MSKQLDMFGDEKSEKITRNKKQVDERLAEFHKRHIKALTPYVIFVSKELLENPSIPDGHPLLCFADAQRHINAMCNSWGMKRTVASEGIVASGNGRYLYMLAYGDVHPSRKD